MEIVGRTIHRTVMGFKSVFGNPNVSRHAYVCPGAVVPKSCHLGKHVRLNGDIGQAPTLEEHVFLSDFVYVWGDVHIGEGTRANPFVFIQDSDHDCYDKNILETKHVPVRIGKRVMLDVGCHIGKGCIIGDDALIGARTVVPPFTKVPSGVFVLGNPRKPMGLKKNKGNKDKWWENKYSEKNSEESLKKSVAKFENCKFRKGSKCTKTFSWGEPFHGKHRLFAWFFGGHRIESSYAIACHCGPCKNHKNNKAFKQ